MIELPGGGRQYDNQTIVIFEVDENSFGAITMLAESFGWEDFPDDFPSDNWTIEMADSTEDDALFFLNSKSVWVFAKQEDGELLHLN